jgi:uncharacterized protein with HEPN domain
MAAKDPRFYLVHIRECCEKILSYTKELGTEWKGSPIVVDAVCRNLEIIGEAASKIDPEVRRFHEEIPWRKIINTRNLLIHAYDQVNPAVLGDIVERDIPELARVVGQMIQQI